VSKRSHAARLAVLLSAAGWAAPAAAAAQAPDDSVPVVSLAEARRHAEEVDPAAVAARLQVETAARERRTAFTDLVTPRVNAATSYTRLSDPFFNFGTGEVSATSASATLQASYVLLGAGKFAELGRSRAAQQSAVASETATRFRTALATDAAYYAVLADRELARLAAERLRRAQEGFGLARVRVQAGEAIAPDSLQLLLEVNRARLGVLRSDSAVAVSRLRLGRQIGLSGPAEAAPVDSSAPPPLPLSQEAAVADLLAQGPEVQAARAAERRAQAVVGVRREGYLPYVTLDLLAAAYDVSFFPDALKRASLALTVNLPIWDGGQRELGVARARADRDVARAEREERERAAAQVMAEAYHGYGTAAAGMGLARVGVAVATENYRVQRARYREGATTILELLEAQGALTEAETQLVQARHATRLALARIEALLGRRLFAAAGTDSTTAETNP